MENIRHTVTHCRSRRQRQINDSKGHPKSCGGFLCHQLSHTCHLESSLLDRLAESSKICSSHFLQGSLHHARSADSHIDDGIRLGHTVECSCHEWIVIRRIAEDD